MEFIAPTIIRASSAIFLLIIGDMNYPLQFSFKIIALAPQITVTDSTGQVISYVRQKMFKLREQIEIHHGKDRRGYSG